MEDQGQGRYSAQQFRDLVKDIPFAMFTTVTAGGGLRSRPMVASENAFDGTLWFFTRTSSAVAQEIAGSRMVNVTYVSAPEDRFVSVSGSAVGRARRRARRPGCGPRPTTSGSPAGRPIPELSLIRIEVARVEFWDRKAGRMREL